MNDMAVHVGGAKAGSRFSTKITMNSKTMILVVSPNSITVDLCVYLVTYQSATSIRFFLGLNTGEGV
jgi:hypothetical protein